MTALKKSARVLAQMGKKRDMERNLQNQQHIGSALIPPFLPNSPMTNVFDVVMPTPKRKPQFAVYRCIGLH